MRTQNTEVIRRSVFYSSDNRRRHHTSYRHNTACKPHRNTEAAYQTVNPSNAELDCLSCFQQGRTELSPGLEKVKGPLGYGSAKPTGALDPIRHSQHEVTKTKQNTLSVTSWMAWGTNTSIHFIELPLPEFSFLPHLLFFFG